MHETIARRKSGRDVTLFGSLVTAIALLAGCSGNGSTAPGATVAPETNSATSPLSAIRFSEPTPAYRQVVLNSKPLADFPFDSKAEGSLVGGYTTTFVNGAKIVKGGPIENERNYHSLELAGSQYVTTSLDGGIPGTGSLVAWVNLSELPSTTGTIFYVCGESQSGNDFDLQFQSDNKLYFYTGGGENTVYAPPVNSLVGKWNMIAVTYVGGTNGSRNIYWNGKLASPFSGNVTATSKTSEFNVGESLVFTGRYFQGSISQVAVWNKAITAKEIATIYNASGH